MSYKIDTVKYTQDQEDERLGAALGFDLWRKLVGPHPTAGDYYYYLMTPKTRAQQNSNC